MFTRFMDMHSGGGQKEKWGYIYIEAPEDEAVIIFYNKFGHNPERVTCTCCGEDYSISEYKTLEDATQYDRKWEHMTIEEYLSRDNVLVVYATDIKDEERIGDVPTQGYIYV